MVCTDLYSSDRDLGKNSGKMKLGRILDILDVETIPSEIWKGELS